MIKYKDTEKYLKTTKKTQDILEETIRSQQGNNEGNYKRY